MPLGTPVLSKMSHTGKNKMCRHFYNNNNNNMKIYNVHIVKHYAWIGGMGSRQAECVNC